ncbi:hypothetical protein E2C01_021939 [Portunus trituberculatus]|uniref:Secreted protein n=1 Tax=Portunus trituberculatus TaxID=210409 RepID=A0A5B7E5P5_PORTR|nr:hypothetical protein [Portunus trituberculatus]
MLVWRFTITITVFFLLLIGGREAREEEQPERDSSISPSNCTVPLYIRLNVWLPHISDQSVKYVPPLSSLPRAVPARATVNNTLELPPPSPGVPRLLQGAIKRCGEAKWGSFEQENSGRGG